MPDEDILLACNASVPTDAAESYCKSIQSRHNTGQDIGISPGPEAAGVVVAELNYLYDVPVLGAPCDSNAWGQTYECPMASCLVPSDASCKNVADYHVINDLRDCCPKMCHFVHDITGVECGATGDDDDAGSGSGNLVVAHPSLVAVALLLAAEYLR